MTADTKPSLIGLNINYDTARNQYVLGQGSIDYDLAGNLEKDFDGHSFAYDAENRQTSYDGDGRRVKKVVGGVTLKTTVYVYDAVGQLVAEYGTPTSGAGTSYLTQDHLGSTRLATGQDGMPKPRHDYLPFGEEIQLADVPDSGRAANQGYNSGNIRQKFTQKERDSETGLDYFLARYYSNTRGRFISPDKTLVDQDESNPQSWNLYTYVGNSPLVYADPLGLWKKVNCTGTATQCWEAEKGDSLGSLANILGVSTKSLVKFFGSANVEAGQVFDVSGVNRPTLVGDLGPLRVQNTIYVNPGPVGIALAKGGAQGYVSEIDRRVAKGEIKVIVLGGSITMIGPLTQTSSVYQSVNGAGQVQYVGITNNFFRRALEHLASKGINIERIPGLQNLTRADAKAIEQTLIEYYGLGKNGGTLLNKINSISQSNPAYAESLKRGAELLKQIGYPGF